ncbi:adenosine deaminase [Streptomyces sp. NBC_00440]|uniref:adenosine deaminase family protein n=1 Tax=unclassified Streptomyces TaxID=2593676 RepID=UPI002E248971|nr:adenosine deaminase [Streptomyces sp. NBC_00932]
MDTDGTSRSDSSSSRTSGSSRVSGRAGRTRSLSGLRAGTALLAAATAVLAATVPGASAAAPRDRLAAERPWQDGAAGTQRYLDKVKDNPDRLRAFLRPMPKGGDLHTHLSGAVPVEALIGFAADDGLCIDETTLSASAPPCGPGTRPARDAVSDHDFRQDVIHAWSMEGFKETPAESGHDHFFATFGKFKAVTGTHRGRLVAEVTKVAAANHQDYVEPLFTPQGDALRNLGTNLRWTGDFDRMRDSLRADGKLNRVLDDAKAETAREMAEQRATLGCDGSDPQPACKVQVRFDFQVGRASEPQYVFTQLLAGFEMADKDPRYVGVNLVQAEDAPIALRDYHLQMRMIKYLRSVYRTAHVTLHAGELTSKVAPREDLRFHIRDAVETAGAERIGHGVDIMSEDRPQQLLRTMARRHIAVEVPLTSNCQILEVCGADHPVNRYLAAGVPVALSTDDQGVSGTDITIEYARAVSEHHLSYRQLRDSARTSLEYAFIQGRSLWRAVGDHRPTAACATSDPRTGRITQSCRELLNASPKATLQWRYETERAAFEARHQA